MTRWKTDMDQISKILDTLKELSSHGVVTGVVSTLLLIVALLVLRWVVGRSILGNDKLPKETSRRWLIRLRNATFFLLLLGLVVIWAEELRVLAVTLFAVAAATVIATKELIQCLSGSVMRTVGRTFTIGDRIEIAGLRGDVIDLNVFTTTILEIGPNQLTQQLTGRAIVLPNSMFVDKPVINESFTDDFVLHVFKVPVELEDWQVAEQDLLAAANTECEPHLEQARQHFTKLGEHDGLFTMSVEPRITFAVPEAGKLELLARVPVPARKKGRIEQAILRRFLLAADERQAHKAAESQDNNAPND